MQNFKMENKILILNSNKYCYKCLVELKEITNGWKIKLKWSYLFYEEKEYLIVDMLTQAYNIYVTNLKAD